MAVNYRVFARKYRPHVFEEVVGQEHVTRTLQNAISKNRIAQAYLLVGPRGIGKTSTARILAKALNCVNGPTPTPCNVCDACKEIAEGNCLDVLEIDGASNNSVEHIRELRENATYAPARGPFKIYLIDEVHMLSTAAFNALLKTLEEPPPHVKFIFATTEAQKVPATITSRCQRFDLRRIPASRMAEHLLVIAQNESIILDADAAQAIARGADGGLRDAESMLDQVVAFCESHITLQDVLDIFGFTSTEVIIALRRAIFSGNTKDALDLIGNQAEAGKDLARLLADFILHLRDLLIAASSRSGEEDIPSIEQILLLLDHFVAVEERMRWAPDRRLHFDVAIIKAIHLLQQVTLDDVLDSLTALGSGAAPPVRKIAPKPQPPSRSTPQVSIPIKSIPSEESRSVSKSTALGVAAAPKEVESLPATPYSASTGDSKAPDQKSDPGTSRGKSKAEEKSESHVVSLAAASMDDNNLWETAREKIIARAPLKSQWLKAARLVSQKGSEFVIEFPPSAKEDFQFIWQRLQGDFEAELSALLDRRVQITASIGDFEEPKPLIEEEEEVAPKSSASEASSKEGIEKAETQESANSDEPVIDPEEEFRNDPLIRKALELFKSEIKTT